MRKIELRVVETDTGLQLNYGDLIHACLTATNPRGFNAEEMEVRLSALAEFPGPSKDKEGNPKKGYPEKVEITEEAYEELMKCVLAFRWQIADSALLNFVKYLKEEVK